MFFFKRPARAVMIALGVLVGSSGPAAEGSVYVSVDLKYPLPSLNNPGAQVVAMYIYVEVDRGWYFDGLSFTGTASLQGQSLGWEHPDRSPLFGELEDLTWEPYGGSASGLYAFAEIGAATPPGVYDRNPQSLQSFATLTARVRNDYYETESDSARVSFTVPGSIVPEPASALLLGVGLAVPAGAAWLRRRRAI